jgi:hypothetical protein
MQDYVTDDVVLVQQLVNGVKVDDVDTLHVNKMTYKGS